MEAQAVRSIDVSRQDMAPAISECLHGPGHGFAARLPHHANARLAARLVSRLVGTKTGTPESRILANDRGRSDEARSRQITMYLLHTSLSLSFTEIADALHRDRTTVSHACRLIEDGRDNGALNAMLCELEGILELIGPLAGFRWSQTAGR